MLALVTAAAARERDTDLPLLSAELPEACIVVWDDASVDWAQFDAVIVRSTWDYHRRRDEFVAWARRTAGAVPLWNPVELIEWNTDKRYLSDLTHEGIPTVLTLFVAPGDQIDAGDLDADIVVKPSVGADSNGVIRSRHAVPAASDHIDRLHRDGLTAMVQPFLAEIERRGETGLVYLGGELSHAFARRSTLADPSSAASGLRAEEAVTPKEASAAERRLGDQVMATVPTSAYARVDLLPTPDGPVVLEVELTEPSLFLHCRDGSPARAASVFRSLAR